MASSRDDDPALERLLREVRQARLKLANLLRRIRASQAALGNPTESLPSGRMTLPGRSDDGSDDGTVH